MPFHVDYFILFKELAGLVTTEQISGCLISKLEGKEKGFDSPSDVVKDMIEIASLLYFTQWKPYFLCYAGRPTGFQQIISNYV